MPSWCNAPQPEWVPPQANNHRQMVTLDGGKTAMRVMRDSTGDRPAWPSRARRGTKRVRPCSPSTQLTNAEPCSSTFRESHFVAASICTSSDAQARKKAATRRINELRDSVVSKQQLNRWLADRPQAKASSEGSASSRLAALRDRVRAKEGNVQAGCPVGRLPP